VKLSKVSFSKRKIYYLGYVISEQGKIRSVAEWPTPLYVKELRSFLGLAGYYRKFVKYLGLFLGL
jgi:hypothetical protein